MLKEKIGDVTLYFMPGSRRAAGTDGQSRFDMDINADTDVNDSDDGSMHLQEIIGSFDEADYHSQITARGSWTAMYQLAESRANIIEWLEIPGQAKILELGAGCGTITSALLKKGAHVTCQDSNSLYCKLNATRHSQAGDGRLTIYAMPFAQCEPQLEDDYDIAVLIGVPMLVKEPETLLCGLRKHLKSEGMLVVATENKFGLKYWAGNQEPYTQRYFAGLENTGNRRNLQNKREGTGSRPDLQIRTEDTDNRPDLQNRLENVVTGPYSQDGLKKLLSDAGFGQQEFYYPYPDYRFALDIYSDKHLPEKGALTYNIANYEGDRILLFDEQKVFDSIIEEGKFPFFANSYLCLAGNGCKMLKQEIIYARYASDRSRAHAVRTDMAGARVYKRPLYPEGAAHIRHIGQAYERLSQQYAGTGLKFNHCTLHADGDGNPYAEFELLCAEALQAHIEKAIAANNMKKVFDILRRMVQYIRNGSKGIPFAVTDGFTEVFGEIPGVAALRGAKCSGAADIDLVLPNILVGEDGTWNVIDYEWTFFFPIPQNFIIYRTLFFLNHENPDNGALTMEALLKAVDISLEEAAFYAEMEERFQQYVTGALVPYREMVNLLERRFFNITELKADYDRVAAQNELLKGRGIWKIARKIKKKLTGN